MGNKKNDISVLGLKVADSINAMIGYWDKDQICRFANSAYHDWFGLKREEIVNKMTLKELLGPRYELNLPCILAVLKGEIQHFEREIILDTGETRYSLINYYPDIVHGEVIGFYVHASNVTPLKLLEQKLSISFERINEQNKRLLNFSNIISHNLKSYSNNLASILDLFSMSSSEDEKNQMLDFLKSISKGFTSTIDSLNEITKSQNLADLTPKQINLHELIEKSKLTLLVQIQSSKAIIKNNIAAEINLLANPVYIESIILNLLTNAIKYRQETKPPIIELSFTQESGKSILKIKDNGKGINLEKHGANLFGMYKTFHGNPDAEGIGLYITKYQIEAMGGRIEVESKENVGTTFTITFS